MQIPNTLVALVLVARSFGAVLVALEATIPFSIVFALSGFFVTLVLRFPLGILTSSFPLLSPFPLDLGFGS